MSDIDTVVVDSLKALDPEWPIREADMVGQVRDVRFRGGEADMQVNLLGRRGRAEPAL